ncbi:MAG: manganese efflux pump MntP family protein [Spirochaetales bacterium]|jgi:putative Mn2+ efflux pump MntP|nr:manganese efflux pump MntP family protein [Spirochaetales bacterium]
MDLTPLIFIAIGLAADSVAVAVSSGAIIGRMRLHHAIRIALFFSFFQGLMPWIGWKIGGLASDYIRAVDHWLAFVILCFIGGKMVYEARQMQDEDQDAKNPLNLYILITLAIATSIDALAVGVTFSFLDISITQPILIISLVTFIFSFAGTYIGKFFGHLFEDKIECVGGIILIIMGCKILIDHLAQG